MQPHPLPPAARAAPLSARTCASSGELYKSFTRAHPRLRPGSGEIHKDPVNTSEPSSASFTMLNGISSAARMVGCLPTAQSAAHKLRAMVHASDPSRRSRNVQGHPRLRGSEFQASLGAPGVPVSKKWDYKAGRVGDPVFYPQLRGKKSRSKFLEESAGRIQEKGQSPWGRQVSQPALQSQALAPCTDSTSPLFPLLCQ